MVESHSARRRSAWRTWLALALATVAGAGLEWGHGQFGNGWLAMTIVYGVVAVFLGRWIRNGK